VHAIEAARPRNWGAFDPEHPRTRCRRCAVRCTPGSVRGSM